MAVCGLVWPYVVFCGRACVALSSCCLLWPSHGLLWLNIDFIGLVSSFLAAVIDPNSFGLFIFVDSRLCTS